MAAKKKKKTAAKKTVKKALKKKTAKKAPAKPKKAAKPQKPVLQLELPWRKPLKGEKEIGVVDDFFAHIGVIAFTLESPLAVGDTIHVHGHTTDLTEAVVSMQIDHKDVASAAKGAAVGIKIAGKCRKGDYVYKAR
jgi:putative protease